MNNLCIFTISLVLISVIFLYVNSRNTEKFATSSQIEIHPDRRFGLLLNEKARHNEELNKPPPPIIQDDDDEPVKEHSHSQYATKTQVEPDKPIDMTQYVKRTEIERTAREISRKYCPVDKDFDINDYVKKSEIPPSDAHCPKVPDMKDFVLKSTIPPAQKCAPCICPKVKVTAGLCKKCPKKEDICPAHKPCGFEQCKHVIKCAVGHTPIPPPPPCPPPARCPRETVKICPAVKIPKPPKCPSPAPCPKPPPCPSTRCPPRKEKCRYYGIKEVPVDGKFKKIVNTIENVIETQSPSSIESFVDMAENNYTYLAPEEEDRLDVMPEEQVYRREVMPEEQVYRREVMPEEQVRREVMPEEQVRREIAQVNTILPEEMMAEELYKPSLAPDVFLPSPPKRKVSGVSPITNLAQISKKCRPTININDYSNFGLLGSQFN